MTTLAATAVFATITNYYHHHSISQNQKSQINTVLFSKAKAQK